MIGGMEVLFIFLLATGLVVALVVEDAVIDYLIAVASGLGTGFLLYHKRYELKARYVIACLSFIVGYVVGSSSGVRIKLMVVFLLCIVFGYFLYYQFHKTTKSDPETEI